MPTTESAPPPSTLPWLAPGEAFPSTQLAWPSWSPAPGLLAAGGTLDVATLVAAYTRGIFPWFSAQQPILWWTTAPRMVLKTVDFVLSTSLRKQLRGMLKRGELDVRFNTAFETVVRACADMARDGQSGTWITEDMVQAYVALHHAGHAHSVETWLRGKLVGGLYAVSIGRMVYGESMFSRVSNASKMALTALVAHCRANDMPLIDCQQQTAHLASLGAAPLDRDAFEACLPDLTTQAPPLWQFDNTCWRHVLGAPT